MNIEEKLQAIKETIEQGNTISINELKKVCIENVEKNCVVAWVKIGETFYSFTNYEKMFDSRMGGYSCYASILDSSLHPMCRSARIENVLSDAKYGGILTIKEWKD